MKQGLRIWLPVFLLTLVWAIQPAERLCAQQSATAPTTAAALDELTGPIALYPDAIVVHVLTAAQNYDMLKLFSGWLAQNANLKGTELQDAAEKFGFSEPLVALALFPDVIQTMVQKPDWTKALGQAVTTDKKAVGDSIQRMRLQAQSLGNLKTTPQQVVVVTNTVVERTIEQQVVVVTNTIVQIQPANPQVIYVPTYPQTVYVQPAPAYSSADVMGAALVGFTVGVIIANNNHYHHHYHDYWDDREDFYEDRRDDAREYQEDRQTDRQGNQDERQTEHQGNQDQRQSTQDDRQSGRQESQGERQSGGASAQSQGTAGAKSPGQSTATPSSRGGTTTASSRSGTTSGGMSGYQSGSTTRTQSSRGSSSMSSSRGGRSGGGRSGGGRR